MAPDETNGWAEYRKLFQQELEDNRRFRETTNQSLDSINVRLTEIGVERRIGKWLLGVGVPALVALGVSLASKILGL